MKLINAKIQTMRGTTIDDGYLIIQDGKIKEFGDMKDVPTTTGEHSIDLEGKLLIPGFIDAHTHLGMNEDGVGEEGDDTNEMADPVTSHVRALDAIDPLDVCFDEARAAGVTTLCVSPGSANPIAGQIVAIKSLPVNWVDKMVLKEPLAMKFALGENPKRVYGTGRDETPYSRMATAAIIRENLAKAQRYQQEIDKAKAEDEDLPEIDFKLEALLPVINREIKAHFHAHRAYDTLSAIRIAEEFNLDYSIIHCTEGHRIADVLAEKGVRPIIGPLLSTRTKPELSNSKMENCADMIHAGVEVAICTDHPVIPVSLLALSASLAADGRITQEQALQTLTYWAAKAVGLEDRVGSIANGLDADLLVFSGDPLAVNSHPEMVFINGEQVI